MSVLSRMRHNILPLLLIIAPTIGQAFYIHQFAVNVPFWDQWVFVSILRLSRQGGNWLPAIWKADDIHRQFFSKLIMVLFANLSDWNVVVEMYFSLLLCCLSLLAMWLIYNKTINNSLWGFIPIAWLLFSWGQWENILWGWQISVYMMAMSVVFCLYFLSVEHPIAIFLAATFGILASYSFNNGLLVWPIGLLALITRKSNKNKSFFWAIVGFLVIILYFTNLQIEHVHSPIPIIQSQPHLFVGFLLANIGLPLGGVNLYLSMAVGTLLVFSIGALFFQMFSREDFHITDSDILLGTLLSFSLSSSLLITLGRIGFETMEWAIGSRYVTVTTIGVASIYLHLLKNSTRANSSKKASPVLISFLIILATGLGLNYKAGLQMGRTKYIRLLRGSHALQNFDRQPDEALANLYAFPQTVRNNATYLQLEKLSVFNKPSDLVLWTIIGDGEIFGEILPDRSLVQKFDCPVSTLRDIGIVFATYGRNIKSNIEVVLTDNGGVLWENQLSTTELDDNKLHYFLLPEPIQECKQRELILEIKSLDSAPGNAVTVWTYPVYYSNFAEIINPHKPTLNDKVIGIELNACFYELVEANNCRQ